MKKFYSGIVKHRKLIIVLLAGANNLEEKYEEFDSAINKLVDTVGNLSYNVAILADAINLLVSS